MRKDFRTAAAKVLIDTKTDHVVYYRDERDENDNILYAWLYNPREYTEDEFEAKVVPMNSIGLVGAVHSLVRHKKR
jgi:hypothetical protein